MSTNDKSSSNKEDLLKSLQQLNSCITLTSVKNDSQGSSGGSEEEGSGSEEEATSALPSALRGIALQGGGKEILSNLLKKDKPEEKKEQSSWLNDWSARCQSISFSSKDGKNDSHDDEDEDEEEGSLKDSDDSKSSTKKENSPPPVSRYLPPGISVSLTSAQIKPNKPSVSEKKVNDKVPPVASTSVYRQLPTTSSSIAFPKGISVTSSQRPAKSRAKRRFEENSEDEDYNSGSKGIRPEVKAKFDPPLPSRPVRQRFPCPFCSLSFSERSKLVSHVPNCTRSNSEEENSPQPAPVVKAVAKKRTNAQPQLPHLSCERCQLLFSSQSEFEEHHLKHISNTASISLPRLSERLLPTPVFGESGEDSDSRSSSSSGRRSRNSNGDEANLKLRLKISNAKNKKKKTKVEIIRQQVRRNSGERSNTASPVNVQKATSVSQSQPPMEAEYSQSQSHTPQVQSELQPSSSIATDSTSSVVNNDTNLASTSTQQINNEFVAPLPPLAPPAPNTTSAFAAFGAPNQLTFGDAAAHERPPSAYQPNFETYTGDWFNEFDSGSRIAAAMTGSGPTEGQNNNNNQQSYNTNSAGQTAYSDDRSQPPQSYNAQNEGGDVNKTIPPPSNEQRDGLFSQAVLGSEMTPGTEDRQGSFEQLCLNDSFGQNQQGASLPDPNMDPNAAYQTNQGYHTEQPDGTAAHGGDLLSELAYLNNGQDVNSNRVSPMNAEFNSHSSNSGTPTSSGHPTPSPTDTSFRALATSPTSPMSTPGRPTPPMPQSSTSPLEQLGQIQPQVDSPMASTTLDGVAAPRLTIANNLMATPATPATTASNIAGTTTFGQQQWANNTAQPNFSGGSYINSAMTGIRPQIPTNYPASYRPSPPARTRGRPPLIGGQMGRPPMMRGPGRPPGSTTMPSLMTAPGGPRGMMPNLQRLPHYKQSPMAGQKRPLASNQSPNKIRREDVNVPTRQKDNDCQIIAVNNLAGDGIGVIANVQSQSSQSSPSTPTATSESTIHLSDSITLSVRPNQTRESTRTEKSGDAGVVANLLASRGITVAPAANEKEASSGSARDERRLPSASDLNLSSAISVHPPTSRDRDGFAVPLPPSPRGSSSSSSNSSSSSTTSTSTSGSSSNVDRPPRPPTVDLTKEVNPAGSQATRFPCSQCERTFPTQALLSDHSKVHQQQAQSRMPFKCHLCTAGFSTQKSLQSHCHQFHQLQLAAGDLAIPIVEFRNTQSLQRMAQLGIRSFIPLNNLQNRGAGGSIGIPILSLENLNNGQNTLQQWGLRNVLTLGPPKTFNAAAPR